MFATIVAKSPLVVRRAKESMNMIDPVDVKRSYRMEQGYTFELNLYGDSDELRQAFVDKRDADLRSGDELNAMSDTTRRAPQSRRRHLRPRRRGVPFAVRSVRRLQTHPRRPRCGHDAGDRAG